MGGTTVVGAVTSEKAVAGMAGAIGIQAAAPVLAKIPGIQHPLARAATGVVIAFAGAKFTDGYVAAVLIGIGAGLVIQGLVAQFVPQLVRA